MDRIVDIAQYIFDEYKKISGETIDEMKLRKLLYFTQREAIAILSTPMFSENFEGWKFGPVCVEIRHLINKKKGIKSGDSKNISTENAYIIKNIIFQYGIYSSWKLSRLSHNEISWRNSRKGIPEGKNGNKKMLLDNIYKDASKIRPYDSFYDMYYDEFADIEE